MNRYRTILETIVFRLYHGIEEPTPENTAEAQRIKNVLLINRLITRPV